MIYNPVVLLGARDKKSRQCTSVRLFSTVYFLTKMSSFSFFVINLCLRLRAYKKNGLTNRLGLSKMDWLYFRLSYNDNWLEIRSIILAK